MNFLARQPFALFGALAFLGLLKDIMTVQSDLAMVLDAVRSVTRPIWDFVFGWLQIEVPSFVKDYLTMGVISSGIAFRLAAYQFRQLGDMFTDITYYPFSIPIERFGYQVFPSSGNLRKAGYLVLGTVDSLFLWPLVLADKIRGLSYRKEYEFNMDGEYIGPEYAKVQKKGQDMYFETFAWISILLVGNYALIYGDISSGFRLN